MTIQGMQQYAGSLQGGGYATVGNAVSSGTTITLSSLGSADSWYAPNTTGVVGCTFPYVQPTPQEQVVPNWKPKSHLVIRHGGAVVESHDSLDDAVDAAKRLAAKEEEHFYVVSPAKVVKPKSVDVEVTEA